MAATTTNILLGECVLLLEKLMGFQVVRLSVVGNN